MTMAYGYIFPSNLLDYESELFYGDGGSAGKAAYEREYIHTCKAFEKIHLNIRIILWLQEM